jgi:hypothetical protein
LETDSSVGFGFAHTCKTFIYKLLIRLMPKRLFLNQRGGYSLKDSGGTTNNPQKSLSKRAREILFFSKKQKVSLAFACAVCLKTTLPIEHEDFSHEDRYSSEV